MKTKRIFIPVLAVALALVLLIPSILSTSNANAADIYFTSVGDRLYQLTSADMPVNINGTIYVPYTVFHNSGVLGTSVYYSQSSQIVQILNSSKELRFKMQTLTTEDSAGRSYSSYPPVFRNGKPYVPAAFVAAFFGFRYSLITDTGVENIVRISTSDSVYSGDDDFVAAAYNRMITYRSDYLATEQPPITNPVTPKPTPTEPPNYSDIRVYLVFFGTEHVYEIFDTLGDLPAAFYMTADEIRDNDDFVRRIVGTGKQIGIIEPVNGEKVTAADYLREVAVCRTNLVLPEPPPLVTIDEAYRILVLAERNSEVTINLSADDAAAEELAQFLADVRLGQYYVSSVPPPPPVEDEPEPEQAAMSLR